MDWKRNFSPAIAEGKGGEGFQEFHRELITSNCTERRFEVTKEIVLNGTQSYVLDKTDVSDVLGAGPYHLAESIAHLTGILTDWTLVVETDAATMRALKIIYTAGGYAVWQALNASNDLAGYLVIYDDDDLLAKIANGVLSKGTITDAAYLAKLAAYIAAPGVSLTTGFANSASFVIAIEAAAALVESGS